ncbi:MAG: DNA-directed RNA polymerase subunit beta, partial [Verrucomicrobiae bacterium]|nr:DNA-directed RNA polymerase subunit beta [Verrucomicrobiae bacterium]
MSARPEKLERLYFGKIEEAIETPNLIEVQLDSYKEFLQQEVLPEGRTVAGLQSVFREVFPIQSYDEKFTLDFVKYEVGEPKQTALESLRDGETFSAPLYVTFSLTDETGTKEERVYMGELPMMTLRGTFVINGAERVIVSQLHRSPGVCFETSLHLNGKTLHGFRIIPDRGTWMEVQFDTNDLLYVYLDRRRRRRKFLATTFLRAIGYPTDEDIIEQFYDIEKLKIDPSINEAELANRVIFNDVLDGDMVVAKAYEPLTLATITQLHSLGVKSVPCVTASHDDLLIKSLRKDPAKNEEEALKDIYRRLRPGDPPTVANARALLKRLFFDSKKYDLTRVGRYKINQKLGLDVDENERVLTAEDFLMSMAYLFGLRRGEGVLDDIDHLGSRRIRAVGELLANQCRVGLARTERLVKERMTLFDINLDGMTPSKLVNPKALAAVVRDFFGRSQLSQFMDQINPLSELTHKRRLSALGPGGLNRDRAGFEVRDVHPSHYGRICPIETPEGPNIGLINSMSCYARINEFGFIETPYRRIQKGKVVKKIDYLTADQEESYLIAQANNPIDDKGNFLTEKITVRHLGEFIEVDPEAATYMDVSPKQLVSVAASLIPFLEHDDANRALMGSNMQRQGVPLLVSESPYVGTGMEGKVARDSRAVVVAEGSGVVAAATAEIVIVTKDGELPCSEAQFLTNPFKLKSDKENGTYVYPLRKFMRSNAGTCINQRPIVRRGDKIKAGQVLADGPNTDNGELALGRNVLVAFMPWNG